MTTGTNARAMLPAERRARVVELLRRDGVVRVHELAVRLGVSAITVRRDITRLAREGVVRRVHGGATLELPATAPTSGGPGSGAVAGAVVGLVVPSLVDYGPDVVRGVREAADELGLRVVLRGAGYAPDDELRQLGALVDSVGVDGLLVAPTTTGSQGAALVRWLRSAEVPVVLLERDCGDPGPGLLESVVSDHRLGAASAVRHLAELGHRRIGLCASAGSPTAPHLRRGWRRACEELGLELDGVPEASTCDHRDPDWSRQLDALLDRCRDSGTTALLVHSDPEALALVQRCQERGIAVPGALSVVTYDDEMAELCDPPLTAVRPPKAAVGRAAVALLAARLRAAGDRPVHRVVVQPELITRGSSAAPVVG
ncbi:substrate-binding domain-containing protein [Actinosynnema sp.]|uniref:LacI family DNA-binding transcriptional regulator n=1 Tax=Actinosynnema sp. TaxID=1872144 RepID=UPI003F872B10